MDTASAKLQFLHVFFGAGKTKKGETFFLVGRNKMRSFYCYFFQRELFDGLGGFITKFEIFFNRQFGKAAGHPE